MAFAGGARLGHRPSHLILIAWFDSTDDVDVTPTDRSVRAAIHALLIDGRLPEVPQIAKVARASEVATRASLAHLAAAHRIVVDDQLNIVMAHPFSGVETIHHATIGDRTWYTNCAWDAFAILGLLGDGVAATQSPADGTLMTFRVDDGRVSPGGIVHFVVPPRRFWDDIVFT